MSVRLRARGLASVRACVRACVCVLLMKFDSLSYSRCFFAKKKCEDPSLTILYPGDCIFTTPIPSNSTQNDTTQPDGGSSTTTHTPHTEDIIHTVFCLNKDQINCTDELDPVCGTDNNFYANKYDLDLSTKRWRP